jgi:hypothetical protein
MEKTVYEEEVSGREDHLVAHSKENTRHLVRR